MNDSQSYGKGRETEEWPRQKATIISAESAHFFCRVGRIIPEAPDPGLFRIAQRFHSRCGFVSDDHTLVPTELRPFRRAADGSR